MLNKKIIFMAILLISLLSLSAVSAADDGANDIASAVDDAVIEESINEDVSNEEPALEEPDENVLSDGSGSEVGPPLMVGSFKTLDEDVNKDYDEINLNYSYYYTSEYDDGLDLLGGVTINHDVTINGNGETIDGSNQARIFRIPSGVSVTLKDINFINGKAGEIGGAIVVDGQCTIINCTFTNNSIDGGFMTGGGAIWAKYGECTVENCTFENNHALSGYTYGGALYGVDAINCNFLNNTAPDGGAIADGNAINCNFTKNTASMSGGAAVWAYATNCTFIQNSAVLGGAMYQFNATNCTFIQNTATEEAGAICDCDATNCTFMLNSAPKYPDVEKGYYEVEDCNYISNILSASDFSTVYGSGAKLMFNIEADNQIYNGIETIISIYKNGTFVKNYTALSGQGWTVNLAAGTYKAILRGKNTNVGPVTVTLKITPRPATITTKAVTTTYNVNKYLVIKIKDNKGNILSGVKVTVTIGTAKTYKTDKNGQIKINVAKKVPKTYTAKISFPANANYKGTKSVKVVVKKATPKMTAKAKSFKVKVATKKYTITLKNNVNKVLKNTKVTLKVNKKTFTAKTNSKGVATFKITNLKKKGKYTATIKFAGSKYYKALSKKVKITVKK